MIKFVLFNNASRAAGYGIGTYIQQLTDGLSSIPDSSIYLVEMDTDEKEFCIIDDNNGIRRFRIPAIQDDIIESEPYCRCVFYFLARRMEFSDNDSIVFQFNYFQHFPIASMLKGQYPNSRIIFTIHYLGWCFDLNGNVNKFHELLSKDNNENCIKYNKENMILNIFKDEQKFLHLADQIIVLSKRTMDIIIHDYKVSTEKIHLIYNGLDNKLADSKISATEKKRQILFVGRLDDIKGLRFLICAFEKIASLHPDTILLVVGDGDFKSYIEQCQKLSGRVVFLGKMLSSELESLYEQSYIGVMPSFHEQCSYTAIEMMRHGLPIIGTDSTGLCEMLDASPHLIIHIEENEFDESMFISDLADKLNLLLSDKMLYENASEASRHRYLERYTTSKMMKQINSVLSSIFNKTDMLSPDYLRHLDYSMMRLIDQRPDIDTEFFGMSGIGVYLWWRILNIKNCDTDNVIYATIMEYLIYYLDWIHESVKGETLPSEMISTLKSMCDNGFYKTVAMDLLAAQAETPFICTMPDSDLIIKNTLKICNCKI